MLHNVCFHYNIDFNDENLGNDDDDDDEIANFNFNEPNLNAAVDIRIEIRNSIVQ